MPDRANVIYVYDGSFEGLLCCVFECFEKRETPAAILTEYDRNPTLFPEKYIETDAEKYTRVKKGIITRVSMEAYELIENVYFSCHPEKELLVCDFARLGIANGKKITSCWANETVNQVLRASKHLSGEAHQLLGFVRFSDYNGVLVSVIEPKNFVLPRLASHFCERYANEAFMIYDKTHGSALIYRPGESRIIPVSDFEEPPADAEELHFRRMWKAFYDTIAIKERENPRCRMGHMQKRYWSRLTELQDTGYGLKEEDRLRLANTKF